MILRATVFSLKPSMLSATCCCPPNNWLITVNATLHHTTVDANRDHINVCVCGSLSLSLYLPLLVCANPRLREREKKKDKNEWAACIDKVQNQTWHRSWTGLIQATGIARANPASNAQNLFVLHRKVSKCRKSGVFGIYIYIWMMLYIYMITTCKISPSCESPSQKAKTHDWLDTVIKPLMQAKKSSKTMKREKWNPL